MNNEGLNSDKEKNLSRRTILRWGLIGAGVILASTVAYTAINQIQSQELSSERSSEFSKTPDWQQNFAKAQTGSIDTSIWHYDTSPEVPGYNDEAQGYTNWHDNVRIENGVGLVLEAHKRDYKYPNDPQQRQFKYTSGRIDTRNSFSFEYGKIEATMKLPASKGVWPAFWLLSGNEVHTINKEYSDDQINDKKFYLHNGEVDVMEYYGDNPSHIEATVHTFNEVKAKTITVKTPELFHTYGVEITPDNIIWTIDNVPYHIFTKKSDNPDDWPFKNNNQLYVILNLAMGGPAGEIDNTQGPWRLEVSNVAFYEFTGKR